MISFLKVAQRLAEAEVEFVIVGGIAIRGHGGNYVTEDLDICYSRKKENLKRIAGVLTPLKPRPRGIDKKLPFVFNGTTLQQGTNFTFTTKIGDVDLLREVKGLGIYEDLLEHSLLIPLGKFSVYILSIPALIVAMEAAARPKDEPSLKVLYALREAQLGQE